MEQKSKRGQQHLLLVRTIHMVRFSKQWAQFRGLYSTISRIFYGHEFRRPYSTVHPYNGTEIEAENRKKIRVEKTRQKFLPLKRGKNFLFLVEISWSETVNLLIIKISL